MKHQGIKKLMALLLAAVLVLPCVAASAFADPAADGSGSAGGMVSVGSVSAPGDTAPVYKVDRVEEPGYDVGHEKGVQRAPVAL